MYYSRTEDITLKSKVVDAPGHSDDDSAAPVEGIYGTQGFYFQVYILEYIQKSNDVTCALVVAKTWPVGPSSTRSARPRVHSQKCGC